jgi:hypothetical protein
MERGEFPGSEHCSGMPEEEVKKLQELLGGQENDIQGDQEEWN